MLNLFLEKALSSRVPWQPRILEVQELITQWHSETAHALMHPLQGTASKVMAQQT